MAILPTDRFGPGRIVATEALERMASIAETLMAASTIDSVLHVILRDGLAGMGAESLGVLLVEDGRLTLVAHENLPPRTVDVFPISLDVHVPMTESVRSACPIWIDDREQRDRWYPLLKGSPNALGSSGILPMQIDGRVIGVLGVGFAGDHLFSETERAYCSILAGLSALALCRHLPSESLTV